MSFEAINGVATNESLRCKLNALGAATVVARLWQTGIDTPEATFPGYSSKPVNFTPATSDGATATITSDVIQFVRTAGEGDPESIGGYWLTVDGVDIGSQTFSSPITIQHENDAVVFLVKISLCNG